MVSAVHPDQSPGRVSTRDGTSLVYTLDVQGTNRPRVALVHSLAMNRSFWEPVAALLRPHADVLTFDCRGHGDSDKPAGPYTFDLFADDLADLLTHVGWDSALIAGASMGGTVSLAFAAKYGKRTEALGLIDTTAWYGADAPEKWAERAVTAQHAGLGELVGFQKTRWFGDAFREQNPALVQAAVDTFLRNDVAAYAATCGMLGAADLRAALPGLHMPTAVMVGEEDYATPVPMAQAMHAAIAGSDLQVIQGARHLTPLECPHIVADGLIQLIGKVAR